MPAGRQIVVPFLAIVALTVVLSGCVRRTIEITSAPSGALVYLNDREIGRTPVEVEFLYYGTYDVRLLLDGHEPLLTFGNAKAPWWDNVGLDLIAEAVPGDTRSVVKWHYDLTPADDDPARLLERAVDLRDVMASTPSEDGSDTADPPAEAAAEADEPASGVD